MDILTWVRGLWHLLSLVLETEGFCLQLGIVKGIFSIFSTQGPPFVPSSFLENGEEEICTCNCGPALPTQPRQLIFLVRGWAWCIALFHSKAGPLFASIPTHSSLVVATGFWRKPSDASKAVQVKPRLLPREGVKLHLKGTPLAARVSCTLAPTQVPLLGNIPQGLSAGPRCCSYCLQGSNHWGSGAILMKSLRRAVCCIQWHCCMVRTPGTCISGQKTPPRPQSFILCKSPAASLALCSHGFASSWKQKRVYQGVVLLQRVSQKKNKANQTTIIAK